MYAVPRGDGLYGRLALVHDARIRKVEVDAKPVAVARARRDAAVAQVQAEQVAVLGWELVERVLGMAADRAVRRRRAGMPGQSAGEPVPDVLTGSPVRAAIRRAPRPWPRNSSTAATSAAPRMPGPGEAGVRLRGFEPPRACAQWLLKPSRMPVSPQPRDVVKSSVAAT